MMNWYQVRITPLTPFRTPWRNDTIWGRLTWAVARGALPHWNIRRWLDAYHSDSPPLVVADGFPTTGFPVPAAWQILPTPDGTKPPPVIPIDELLRLAKGAKHPIQKGRPLKNVSRLHVTLDRNTSCAAQGELYVADAWSPPENIPIIVLTLLSRDITAQDLDALWRHVMQEGWGKRRSTGYGAFEFEIAPIEQPSHQGNGFVTLGHCIPTDDLPEEGLWRWAGSQAVPHDPLTATTHQPPRKWFTLALRPGACFRERPPRLWAGRMLPHPLDNHPNYVKYGLAPAWPIVWPE